MILGQLVILATVFGAVSYAGVAVAIHRYGEKPGDRLYTVAAIGGVIWAGTYAISFLTFDLATQQALAVPLWFGRLLVPIAWFLAMLAYSGRDSYISSWLVTAISVPAVVTLALIVTNRQHTLVWTTYEIVEVWGVATVSYEFGTWLLVQTIFSYLLLGLGVLLLVEVLLTSELYRRQVFVLLVAVALPSVFNIKSLLELPPAATLDLSPVVFSVTSVAIGYALVNYDLFSLSPATRRAGQRAAIDDFGDSVFVVDTDDRIVDLNESAHETLDQDRERTLGRQIGDVLAVETFDPNETGSVQLETVDGNREFDVTSSTLTDRRDRQIGWTVLLHDVTRTKRQQQRLSVLDRVMRHNIRNSMSVVMGCADEVAGDSETDDTELAATIERESAQLVDLSETARTVERIVGREQAQERVGVATVLQGVRERLVGSSTPRSVTVETPEALLIDTDPVVFEEVCYHAVRALCADVEASTSVGLVTSETAGGAEVAIVGAGLQVPQQERRAIENGQESPLEHTDALDLWLVNWGVERLGGSLAFEQGLDDGRTAAIVLSVPDRRARYESEEPFETA